MIDDDMSHVSAPISGYLVRLVVLALVPIHKGSVAASAGPGVEVVKGDRSTQDVLDALADAAPLDILLTDVKTLVPEKWDWTLPNGLLRKACASLYSYLDEAHEWLRKMMARELTYCLKLHTVSMNSMETDPMKKSRHLPSEFHL